MELWIHFLFSKREETNDTQHNTPVHMLKNDQIRKEQIKYIKTKIFDFIYWILNYLTFQYSCIRAELMT